MARVVELTENDLLLFRQDVAGFKRTVESIDETVRASAEGSSELLETIVDLCESLRTMTQKLEQVLVVNERLEWLLNRIEVLESVDDATDPNTSISHPPDSADKTERNTDIRELVPPDIFAPCAKCQQATCQCIQEGGPPVCESCLEDPCTCMAQYETRPDTSL